MTEWLQVTTSDYKWQRVTTSQTTRDYESGYEWLRVITSDYQRLRVKSETLLDLERLVTIAGKKLVQIVNCLITFCKECFFLWKNWRCMFFTVLYYSAYLLLYDFPFIHPVSSIGVLEWRLFEILEGSVRSCFENCSESFWKFAGKTSIVESFLSTLTGLRGTSPESCLEQLLFREPFSGRFYKKELPHRRYLKNFPDF